MGGFVGDIVGGLGDIVSDVAGGIGDVVSGVGDAVSDLGSSIDDLVGQVPGGWGTVASLATLTGAPASLGSLFGGVSEAVAADAAFVAADAAQLAAQGLSQSQIASTLASSGVSSFVAADAAALAASGLSEAAIAQNIAQSGAGSASLFTSPAAAQAAASNTSLLSKAGNIIKGLTTGGGTAGAGYTGTDTTGLLLSKLLGSGIDAVTASNIANQLKETGAGLSQQATQAGAAAAVPFTPYTVTTGTGTATVSPTGATSALSPQLQALQGSLFGQAGQAIGAINPAQASQQMYGQLEALAAPSRQIEQNRLLGSLGAKGLLGYSQNLPTVGGDVMGVNPYVQSLLSAQQTAQGQNALNALQFGTSEAQRQAALGTGLLSAGTGLEAQAAAPLSSAYTIGSGLTNLAQTDAGRQLQATLGGLGLQVPFQTTAANIRAGQTGLLGQTAQSATNAVLKGIFG